MTREEYEQVREVLRVEAEGIQQAKRPAYTLDNEDVLHNFKSVGLRLGLTPLQAWGVYWLKHVDAISAFVKDPTIPQAEPILGRFADNRNYLDLGLALAVETYDVLLPGLQILVGHRG